MAPRPHHIWGSGGRTEFSGTGPGMVEAGVSRQKPTLVSRDERHGAVLNLLGNFLVKKPFSGIKLGTSSYFAKVTSK